MYDSEVLVWPDNRRHACLFNARSVWEAWSGALARRGCFKRRMLPACKTACTSVVGLAFTSHFTMELKSRDTAREPDTLVNRNTCMLAAGQSRCPTSTPLLCAAASRLAAGCLATARRPCRLLGCLFQRLLQPKCGDDVLPTHLDAGYGAICRQSTCKQQAGLLHSPSKLQASCGPACR